MKLEPGIKQKTSTPEEINERRDVLRLTVEKYLPELPPMIQKALAKHDNEDNAMILLHQDGFASGFHTDEYTLLGMAIKYAGLYGVEVCIIGNAGETF
jgi:hypothetical protein